MNAHFALARRAAGALLLALILFACSSDSDSDASSDDPPESSDTGNETDDDPQSDPTPDEPADAGSDVPVFAVGETFTINAGGTFEATYLGLADLGTAESFQSGDVQCYAILGEVTLVAEDEDGFPTGLSPQRPEALGADGTPVGISASAACSVSPLSEAGYTNGFGVDWAEGVTETIYFDFFAVPVGDEELLDRVSPYPAVPEFELEATITETLA